MRIGAVLALAAAAGLIAWFFINRSDDSTSTSGTTTSLGETTPTQTTATSIPAAAFSAADIAQISRSTGQPIYWAGPKAGFRYELTKTSTGKVYVRYLPKGVEVGDPRAAFLIVATYPFPGAYNALRKVSRGHLIPLAGKGIAAVDQSYQKSVHLAFPGVQYQVEVYDPSPATARRVAVSGDVSPVQ